MKKIILLIKAEDGCCAEKIRDEVLESDLVESVEIF